MYFARVIGLIVFTRLGKIFINYSFYFFFKFSQVVAFSGNSLIFRTFMTLQAVSIHA